MRRAINSNAVAERAGVSRTTVSLVLNQRDGAAGIPAATRDRVLRAAAELGYQPNHLARALLTGRSYLIRLLVQRVHPAFFSRATEAFHAALRGSGYDLHLQETLDWSPEQWEAAAADRWPADGILVFEESAHVPHLLAGLRGRIPVVNVGSTPVKTVPHVGVDLYAGTVEAVRHLRATGRTRIAYLGWDFVGGQPRGAAYRDEVQRAGRTPLWITTPWDPVTGDRGVGARTLGAYLDAGDPHRIDALVCFNDEMAVGALRALRSRGRSVPGDVALVGCDGIEETAYHDPPLTTLHFPYEEAARAGWQLLRERIEAQKETDGGPDTPAPERLLAPELVVRGSSAPRSGPGT